MIRKRKTASILPSSIPREPAAGRTGNTFSKTNVKKRNSLQRQSCFSRPLVLLLLCISLFVWVRSGFHQGHIHHRLVPRVRKSKLRPLWPSTGPVPQVNSSAMETIQCHNNFGILINALVNDDYCDCSNGEDEPHTSACSDVLVQRKIFACVEGSTKIFLSRVNDGIWDCPDGSDEIPLNRLQR